MDRGLHQPQMLLILSCVITAWVQSGATMSSSKTCWSGTWHNYMTSSYESRSNVSSTGWPRIRPCAGSSARGKPAQRSLHVLRDCPPKPTGPSETRFAGLLSIELRCVSMQGSLSASSSVYMRWTKGAQVTGLGAAAGPTPAARATLAHGPEYPATLAVLAFSSCQDQLEHPTARSQPLSCVRALDVLSGHAVYLESRSSATVCTALLLSRSAVFGHKRGWESAEHVGPRKL